MLAYSEFTLVVALNVVVLSLSEKSPQTNPPTPIDAPVLESKDVLLQMLEKKLKEIKDKKKLRNSNDYLPKNVDFNLRSNGISAVGDAELLLRYGKNGQGIVNLTADGISNVGRVQVVVGSGDNGLQIPGLGNLFVGSSSIRSEDRNVLNQLQYVNPNEIPFGFRRQTNAAISDKVNNINVGTDNVDAKKDVAQVEISSNLAVGNNDGANAVSAVISDTSSTVNVNAVMSIKSGQTVAASSSVINSEPPIKSDTVAVNTVTSNGENVNKIK